MKITKQQLERLEQLAGFYLREDERDEMEMDLTRLLAYVSMLEGVDGGEELPALENILRADEVEPSLFRDEILKNTPETDGEMILVPRTVD